MAGAGPGVSPRCSSVQAIPSSTKFTKPSSPAAKPHLTTPCSTPWAPSWLSPSCGFGSVFALRISLPEHTEGGPHAIHLSHAVAAMGIGACFQDFADQKKQPPVPARRDGRLNVVLRNAVS